MTEQLLYNLYKITNDVDQMEYAGSTRQNIRQRFNGHCRDARGGSLKKIATHIREVGPEHFQIELIREVLVESRLEARKLEQEEIEKIPPEFRLNMLSAYSYNHEKTRNQDKKRAVRRAYYHRQKRDPVWHEREKERNKLRMREKRSVKSSCRFCKKEITVMNMSRHQQSKRCKSFQEPFQRLNGDGQEKADNLQ